MQDIQPDLVERYQILLQNDPKSQVFAPLTEAYRRMGLVEEAFRIAVRGVQLNPNFGGGRVALAKVLLDRENLPGAIEELERAIELAPDNILAFSLLADGYLHAKRPKDALRAFKMVLFLAPNQEKAAKAVRKLESLTADEYEEDLFEMKPLPQVEHLDVAAEEILRPLRREGTGGGDLERTISLADAFLVRNDVEKALGVLNDARAYFGPHPELIKRLKYVNQRHFAPPPAATGPATVPDRHAEARDRRIEALRDVLARVHAHQVR